MTAILRPAVTVVGIFTVMLGLAAPLAMTGIAQVVFPQRAGGSLVERDGRVVGSALMASFRAALVSAAPLGHHRVRSGQCQARPAPCPTTLPPPPPRSLAQQVHRCATASPNAWPRWAAGRSGGRGDGLGLRPRSAHLSETRKRQVARIAAARGLAETRVAALVADHTEGREFGLFGEPRVNVLRLNLALEALR